MIRILTAISFLFIVGFLGLYPGWYDSAELSAGSFGLGITHPPGQPFYIICNYIFGNIVMLGTVAFRHALLSALCGLGSVILAYKIICETHKLSNLQKIVLYISLLTIPSLGVQLSRVELYTMILFLNLLNLYCVHLHIKKQFVPFLYLAYFICGLAFCVHTLLAFFQTLLLTFYCLHIILRDVDQGIKVQFKKCLWFCFFFIFGFSCNAYLLIRAQTNPDIFMMPINNMSDFLNYILAKTYAKSFSINSLEYNMSHFSELLKIISPFIIFVLPAFIFVRFHHLNLKKTWLLLFFVLVNAIPWIITPYAFENPDAHGYILTLCFALIMFSWHFLLHIQNNTQAWKKYYTLGLAIPLVCFQSFYFISALNTHGSEMGKNFSKFLSKSPYNSVSILTSDHWVFNYWYNQSVQNMKPEHWVLPAELSKNKWYQEKNLDKFKSSYSVKIFEETENIQNNELFLSSKFFNSEKENVFNYCKNKINHDFSDVEKTICTYIIVQWSKQYYREKNILKALHLLENFYDFKNTDVTCPYPNKSFQSPFLLDTSKPIFLPSPNLGMETLIYFYLQCQNFPKDTLDKALKMDLSNNSYILLTQGILENSNARNALDFLKKFKSKFKDQPEQYVQALAILNHKIHKD